MPLQGSLSIERMCELARVSRASFYRSLKEQRPAEEETEVRSAIQRLGASPALWISTSLCRVAPTRNASEPQEGSADDAERQSAGPATAAIHGHDPFESQVRGISELGPSHEAERDGSASAPGLQKQLGHISHVYYR
jgi:hypothetical protein